MDSLDFILALDRKNLTKENFQHCHETRDKIVDLWAKAEEMSKLFYLPPKPHPGKNKKVNVFARVRPLSDEEAKTSQALIPGLLTKSTVPKEKGQKISAMESVGQGLEALLGEDCNNLEAYKQVIAPNTDILLEGGRVSLFCYGHSGTGKTHTTLGYKDEPGLFKLGCEEMFRVINKYNQSPGEDGKLMIEVRFTEIYLGRVYDLLNNRAELKLLEDGNGVVHIRAQTERKEDGTVVNRDQKFVIVKDLDHLLDVLKDGIILRAAGCSSIHDQSSRSHAMLEMRVLNEALVSAMEEEVIAISKLAPHEKSKTDTPKKFWFLMFKKESPDGSEEADVNKDLEKKGSDGPAAGDANTDLEKKESGGSEKGYSNNPMLEHFRQNWSMACDVTKEKVVASCTEGLMASAWKQCPDIHDYEIWTTKGWMDLFNYIALQMEETYNGFLRDIPPILEIRKRIEEIKARAPELCGGKLTLVDLAGADHDTRDLAKTTKVELRESAQINKELSTLKGVMSLNEGRRPWRDTKLTHVLKNILEPPEGGTNQPIMVACVSPSITQERDTVNTLRYAQMVAGVVENKKVTQKRAKNARALEIQKQIRQIYAENCPEKTEIQVDTILGKFKGREAQLLQKVRRKYTMNKQQKLIKQKNQIDADDSKASNIGQLLSCGTCATGKGE